MTIEQVKITAGNIEIQMETRNAAFDDGYFHQETGRILNEYILKLKSGDFPTFLRDINGNKVATVTYLKEESVDSSELRLLETIKEAFNNGENPGEALGVTYTEEV